MSVIRDVVIRLSVDQVPVDLTPPDTSGVKQELEGLQESYRQVADTAMETSGQTSASMIDVSDSIQQAGQGANELADDLMDMQLRSAESLAKIGTGAFQTARGFAFLSASSEEDLQAMMESLAKAQAAFDMFVGAKDILIGTVEAFRSMRSAASIASAGNVALATSNTAVGVSGTTAAAGMTALWASLGPVGWAVIGIGAAVSALAIAWSFWEDADDSVDEVYESLDRLNAAMEYSNAIRQATVEHEGKGRDVILDSLQKRIALLDNEESKLEAIRQARQKIEILDSGERPEEVTTAAEAARIAHQEFQERMRGVDSMVQLSDASQIERQNILIGRLEEARIKREEQLGISESLAVAAEFELKSLDALVAKQQEMTGAKMEELETAKELTREEERRNQTFAEAVGSLDVPEFQQFEMISRKAERVGVEGLNRDEAKFLESNFGRFEEFGGQLDRRNRNIGNRRGAFDLAGRFGVNFEGEGSRLDEARKNEEEQRRELVEFLNAKGSSQSDIREAAEKMTEELDREREAVRAALTASATRAQENTRELNRITAALKEVVAFANDLKSGDGANQAF